MNIMLFEQVDMVVGQAVNAVAGNGIGDAVADKCCRIDHRFGEDDFFLCFCCLAIEDAPARAGQIEVVGTLAHDPPTVESCRISG